MIISPRLAKILAATQIASLIACAPVSPISTTAVEEKPSCIYDNTGILIFGSASCPYRLETPEERRLAKRREEYYKLHPQPERTLEDVCRDAWKVCEEIEDSWDRRRCIDL